MSTRATAYLVLENGEIFQGQTLTESMNDTLGEVVFTTGMTGYLETLTDPSYYGQIIVQTFPLIGNYGVIQSDFESIDIFPKAYIVNHLCLEPSNFRSDGDLGTFLLAKNIPMLFGIDTRKLTRLIRNHGALNGIITTKKPDEINIDEIKKYTITNAVQSVSRTDVKVEGNGKYTVALIDYGSKKGIIQNLIQRDCTVHIFPQSASADDILAINPDGIMLTNGPGDPSAPENDQIINTLKTLKQAKLPIFGICLGHQLLALASGYETQKLKFGHRGTNQPVKDTKTGVVYITSQNHGYAVVAKDEESSFVSVNDNTCEGIEYSDANAFSVQFHPEANSGPKDTTFLFDKFVERMKLNN